MEITAFLAPLEQVIHSPASLLVIVGVTIVAYLLELWPNFNSRFIPHICILVGAVAYPLFSAKSSVPVDFPYPIAVLILNGLISGFIAVILHKKLVMWLVSRYGGKDEAEQKPPTTQPPTP